METEKIECPAKCGLRAPADQTRKVHMLPGTQQRCVFVQIIRRRFLPEHVHDGDINAPYDEPEIEKLYTEFGHDPFPEQAYRLLDNVGALEYSASHYQMNPHAWYSGNSVLDYDTAECEEISVTLHGFTEPERRETWRLVGDGQ